MPTLKHEEELDDALKFLIKEVIHCAACADSDPVTLLLTGVSLGDTLTHQFNMNHDEITRALVLVGEKLSPGAKYNQEERDADELHRTQVHVMDKKGEIKELKFRPK